MSAKTVRTAVAAFLAPPNVAGLNKVYRSQPKLIPGDAYFGTAGAGQGGIAVVHIGHSEDRVLGRGAGVFERAISHGVDIVLRYRDVSGDAEVCQDGFDDMVEALKARIRSDVALGTAGSANPITFSGVGSGVPGRGATDLVIDQDLPRQEPQGGGVLIWAVLRLTNVVEIVIA